MLVSRLGGKHRGRGRARRGYTLEINSSFFDNRCFIPLILKVRLRDSASSWTNFGWVLSQSGSVMISKQNLWFRNKSYDSEATVMTSKQQSWFWSNIDEFEAIVMISKQQWWFKKTTVIISKQIVIGFSRSPTRETASWGSSTPVQLYSFKTSQERCQYI